MSQLWERYNPPIMGIIAIILALILKVSPSIKGFEKVLDGVITFSSIVIGFLGALLAIILSISKSKVMKHLYNHVDVANGKNLLFRYFKEAIIVGFLVVITSIFMYIFSKMKPITLYGQLTFISWIFLTTFFIAASFRIINILMKALFLEATYTTLKESYQQKKTLSEEELRSLRKKGAKNREF